MIFQHPSLGLIRGVQLGELIQFRSLPYASIQQRFARSELLRSLPRQHEDDVYDATQIGPSSIQPKHAAKMDTDSNQLPSDILGDEQPQSEDCLRITITIPTTRPSKYDLPVLAFLHGGAFFINSGERPYYSPLNFLRAAIAENKPICFLSINYRLGALGFFHSTQASDLVPANNALHDQLRAFEWIKEHVGGFGGDYTNVTAIGQSAGAESLSLHNISGQKMPLYKRSITFSGTPVTMPAKSPREHEENFRAQAGKLNLTVEGRKSTDIAKEMIDVSVDSIRNLSFVGAPCSSSEILPYDRPTMQLSRNRPSTEVEWLESQIVSTAGYDGSISWIITKKNPKRKDHANSFITIAEEVLKKPQQLLDLYEISHRDAATEDEDDEDLTKICLFESDIGFIAAANAVSSGATRTKTYFQFFDLPNPFEGYLPSGQYTTHSWDIVALLGAYDDRLSEQYTSVISAWRKKIIEYCNTGRAPWLEYKDGSGMLVTHNGLDVQSLEKLNGERRDRLDAIAREEAGEHGHDLLWEGVCRRWLDVGH